MEYFGRSALRQGLVDLAASNTDTNRDEFLSLLFTVHQTWPPRNGAFRKSAVQRQGASA
jgi:hypothetical protein